MIDFIARKRKRKKKEKKGIIGVLNSFFLSLPPLPTFDCITHFSFNLLSFIHILIHNLYSLPTPYTYHTRPHPLQCHHHLITTPASATTIWIDHYLLLVVPLFNRSIPTFPILRVLPLTRDIPYVSFLNKSLLLLLHADLDPAGLLCQRSPACTDLWMIDNRSPRELWKRKFQEPRPKKRVSW